MKERKIIISSHDKAHFRANANYIVHTITQWLQATTLTAGGSLVHSPPSKQ